MIYLGLISLIYALWFLLKKVSFGQDSQRRMIFIGGSFLLMFILTAFRSYSVGADTENYLTKFQEIRALPFKALFDNFFTARVEIGYALLNKIIGLFTGNYRFVLVINALIVYVGMFFYAYYSCDTKDDLTLIILFVCTGLLFYTFNIMRQMIAIVFLLNSWMLLKKRKWVWSGVLFAISLTFHISALSFGAVYLLYFLKKNRNATACIFGFGFVLLLLLRPIIKLLSKALPMYRFYADHALTTAGGIWAVWTIQILIIAFFWFYYFDDKRFVSIFGKPSKSLSETESFCIPAFTLIYIIFVSLGTRLNYMERIGIYFLPFCIPLFCNFEAFLREKSLLLQKIYKIGMHTGFIGYLLLTVFSSTYKYSFF